VSDARSVRFLATQYASVASREPIDRYRGRDARCMIDALERLELLDPDDAATWRERLARLGIDAIDRPLLPAPLRAAARSYMAERPEGERRGFAQRALESVGALSWRDDEDASDPPGLVVERVIAAPPQPAGEVTIASLVLYANALELYWYAAPAIVGGGGHRRTTGRIGGLDPLGLELTDDRGTSYQTTGSGHSSGGQRAASGRTMYTPSAGDARWLEVSRAGSPIVRVPLHE
jgi:hypothetical protein